MGACCEWVCKINHALFICHEYPWCYSKARRGTHGVIPKSAGVPRVLCVCRLAGSKPRVERAGLPCSPLSPSHARLSLLFAMTLARLLIPRSHFVSYSPRADVCLFFFPAQQLKPGTLRATITHTRPGGAGGQVKLVYTVVTTQPGVFYTFDAHGELVIHETEPLTRPCYAITGSPLTGRAQAFRYHADRGDILYDYACPANGERIIHFGPLPGGISVTLSIPHHTHMLFFRYDDRDHFDDEVTADDRLDSVPPRARSLQLIEYLTPKMNAPAKWTTPSRMRLGKPPVALVDTQKGSWWHNGNLASTFVASNVFVLRPGDLQPFPHSFTCLTPDGAFLPSAPTHPLLPEPAVLASPKDSSTMVIALPSEPPAMLLSPRPSPDSPRPSPDSPPAIASPQASPDSPPVAASPLASPPAPHDTALLDLPLPKGHPYAIPGLRALATLSTQPDGSLPCKSFGSLGELTWKRNVMEHTTWYCWRFEMCVSCVNGFDGIVNRGLLFWTLYWNKHYYCRACALAHFGRLPTNLRTPAALHERLTALFNLSEHVPVDYIPEPLLAVIRDFVRVHLPLRVDLLKLLVP